MVFKSKEQETPCTDCGTNEDTHFDYRYDRFGKYVRKSKCRNCTRIRNKNRENSSRRHDKEIERKLGLCFDYDVILKSQNGTCKICKMPPMGKRLSVDHCHIGQFIRGLICQNCNLLLGYAKDNPNILQAAIKYLQDAANVNENRSFQIQRGPLPSQVGG